MKKIILIALLLATVRTVDAQIANWIVNPEYDGLQQRNDALLEVQNNGKLGLITGEGKEFLSISYDSIGDFHDNKSLLFKDSRFVGFVNREGKVVDNPKDYNLVDGMEFFSGGFLPVKKNNHYYFINGEGAQVAGPFAMVEPYFSGYAPVRCYVDIQKNTKDTYLTYINSAQHAVRAKGLDKNEDVSLISTFRDGLAMCIYKRKAYFVTDSMTAAPIITDSLAPKKSIITFEKNNVVEPSEDGFVLNAKAASFYFNHLMQLDKIETGGTVLYAYQSPNDNNNSISSELSAFNDNGSVGIKYKDEVVLPGQFEEVIPLKDNKAAVKTGGKWGVIAIDPLNKIIFKLNNNEHIGFGHRYFTSKLSASMPPYLKSNAATIVSKSDDCEIQIESRHENNNVERNTLTYNCRLAIPDNLSDTLSMHDYIFALKYNGFTSLDHKVTVPEWYVKSYEVEMMNNEFTLMPKDTIAVEFDIVKSGISSNDNTNYFKTVELITPDFDGIQLDKITENHYSFCIGDFGREKILFIIRITEAGCPSIEYPFEIVFTKSAQPVSRKGYTVTINPLLKTKILTSKPNADTVSSDGD